MNKLDNIEARLAAATQGPWVRAGACTYVLGEDAGTGLTTLVLAAPADIAYLLRIARAAEWRLHDDACEATCHYRGDFCTCGNDDMRRALEDAPMADADRDDDAACPPCLRCGGPAKWECCADCGFVICDRDAGECIGAYVVQPDDSEFPEDAP